MLKERYVNPYTDFGFKKLFGSEPNKVLVMDFLNQILPAHHQIQALTFTPNERLESNDMDRKAIFDIFCTSKSGERFIVEMQKAKQNYFKDRSVYYATFPIQEQARKGHWDFNLAAVYTVGILDFVFDEDKAEQEVLHTIQLKDQHGDVFYEKLTFIYLEMPNFHKTEDELETTFDKWLYVLKHLPDLPDQPEALQGEIFRKLFEAAELAKFTRAEMQQYENSLKIFRDLKNVIDTAWEEGLAQGIEQGIEQGRKMRDLEIALNGLKNGVLPSVLAQITSLSEDEIENLKAR